MSKQAQQFENEYCLQGFHWMENIIKSEQPISNTRLFTCSACVLEYDKIYVLQSYATPIALIEKETGVCYDFLRYVYGFTRTSAQHISKFMTKYNSNKKVLYRPL